MTLSAKQYSTSWASPTMTGGFLEMPCANAGLIIKYQAAMTLLQKERIRSGMKCCNVTFSPMAGRVWAALLVFEGQSMSGMTQCGVASKVAVEETETDLSESQIACARSRASTRGKGAEANVTLAVSLATRRAKTTETIGCRGRLVQRRLLT